MVIGEIPNLIEDFFAIKGPSGKNVPVKSASDECNGSSKGVLVYNPWRVKWLDVDVEHSEAERY
jgi:hypothetical protein